MKARPALLLVALLVLPVAAALRGAAGPLSVRLNLGPGDGPYLAGFFPVYEIDEGVGLQWSRPRARISLPLAFAGPAEFSVRFGPPPKGPALVEVILGDRPLATFDCCRHRALQRRRLDAEAPTPLALVATVSVSGPEIRERGLFLDWIETDLGPGARLWLTGPARFRAAALVALVFLILCTVGFSATAAAATASPLALTLAVALLRDPWLVHRLLTLIPEALLFVVWPLAALGRVLAERGLVQAATLRTALALSIFAFVGRGAALNHPDFFYPDLMIHARLVGVVGDAGWDFLRAPTRYLYTPREEPTGASTLIRATSGLWLRRIGGVDMGLPYSLAVHALLAPLHLSDDARVSALKLLGVLFSIVPVVAFAFLAPRFGAPAWSALLLVAAPTALVELSLGTVPAVFGHALDALLVLWLGLRAPRLTPHRLALEGALLLAAVQLGYVSSVLTASLLVALLVLVASRGREEDWPRALALAFALGAGSTVALGVYYRDFVPGALAAVRLAFAGPPLPGSGSALDLGGSRVEAAFLLWGFPIVAVAGAVGFVLILRRVCWEREVFLAWVLTVCALGLLRRTVPGVFGFVHLALFATPLLCLAAGRGFEALSTHSRAARALALALVLLVCAHGFWQQIQSVFDQLDNAR